MKPMDVARRLNIGRSTVAAWSKEFAPFLSPTAAGEKNQTRDFTSRDMQIFAAIKQMADRSVRREDMVTELRRLQADDWRELPPLEESVSHDLGAQLVPMASAQAVFQVERNSLLREITRLENDVRELKAERTSDRTEREQLIRDLQDARTRLELYESGRLKPQ